MRKIACMIIAIVFAINLMNVSVFSQVNSSLTAREASLEKKYGITINVESGIMNNEAVYRHVLSTVENVYNRFPAGLIKEVADYFKGKKIPTSINIRYYGEKDYSSNTDDGSFAYSTKSAVITHVVKGNETDTQQLEEWPVAHDMGHLIHKYIESKYGATNFKNKWVALNGGAAYKGNNYRNTENNDLLYAREWGSSSYENDVAALIEQLITDPHVIRVNLINNPSSGLAKKVNLLNDVLDQCASSIAKGQKLWGSGMPQSPSASFAQSSTEAFNKGCIPTGLEMDGFYYDPDFTGVYTTKITRQDFCLLIKKFIEVNSQMTLKEYVKSKGKNTDWYYRAELSGLGDLDSYETNYPFFDTGDTDLFNLYSLGIFNGLNKVKYINPGEEIPREEAAALLYNTAKIMSPSINKTATNFADKNLISSWAKDGIDYVVSNNILGQAGGNKFAPQDKLSYEQSYSAILNFCKLDLLKTQAGGKEAQFVIQPKYDSVQNFSEGLALVTSGGKYLYIDKTGKEVIKLPYSETSCEPHDFKGGYAMIELRGTDSDYSTLIVIDKTGKEVRRVNYMIYSPSRAFDQKVVDINSFTDKTKSNRERYFMDVNGNKYLYDQMFLNPDGTLITTKNSKYGLMNQSLKVFLNPEYDSIEYAGNGLYVVRKGLNGLDLYGVVSNSGKVIVPVKYSELDDLKDGFFYVSEYETSAWGVYDKNGAQTIKVGQYELYSRRDEGLFVVHDGNTEKLLNKSGQTLYETSGDIGSFEEGYAIIQNSDRDDVIIDTHGKEAYHYQGSYNDFVFSEGLGTLYKDTYWVIIDKAFKETGRTTNNYSTINLFHEGLATYNTDDGKWGFIDKTGRELLAPQNYSIDDFKYGKALIKNGDEKLGLIDKTGKIILEPKYDEIIPGNGINIVKRGSLYGLYDDSGKVILDMRYKNLELASSYDDDSDHFDFLATGDDPQTGNKFCVDKAGNKFTDVRSGSGGFAIAETKFTERYTDPYGDPINTNEYEYRLFGFIDRQGNRLTPIQYTSAMPFDEDFAGGARVEMNDKYGYIDKTGKTLIPVEYKGIGDFVNGVAPATKGAKSGFVDISGKQVIQFAYDATGPISEGLAYVKKNGKYGFIVAPIR